MSQLYVRVRTGFYSHIKTLRLKVHIGDDAFWVPPRMWAYAAEEQPDGDLSDLSSEDLAMLLGCMKHAKCLLQALKDTKFLDLDGKIHDWDEHNGYHKSFSDRARKAALAMHKARREREEIEISEAVQRKEKEERGDKQASSMPEACSKQVWTPDSQQIRLNALFRRKPTNQWNRQMLKAWAAIAPLDEDDLKAVERYYSLRLPPDKDYRRRDLPTLLNNFHGEVDRARGQKETTCL